MTGSVLRHFFGVLAQPPIRVLQCTVASLQLRAGNGGANPAYGNPDKRPVFWPQHYWPWEQLSDVHSRPRGMEEPLNYSEMMKLAIARGYR